MTELDQLIATAYASSGKQEDVNKVYLAFLRGNLFLPVKKMVPAEAENEEPFHPLFAVIDGQYFMLMFDTLERLTEWAGDQFAEMGYVELTGKDIAAGVKENVYLGLNYGSQYYKEFSPDEVLQLKKIVARIDQLKQ